MNRLFTAVEGKGRFVSSSSHCPLLETALLPDLPWLPSCCFGGRLGLKDLSQKYPKPSVLISEALLSSRPINSFSPNAVDSTCTESMAHVTSLSFFYVHMMPSKWQLPVLVNTWKWQKSWLLLAEGEWEMIGWQMTGWQMTCQKQTFIWYMVSARMPLPEVDI